MEKHLHFLFRSGAFVSVRMPISLGQFFQMLLGVVREDLHLYKWCCNFEIFQNKCLYTVTSISFWTVAFFVSFLHLYITTLDSKSDNVFTVQRFSFKSWNWLNSTFCSFARIEVQTVVMEVKVTIIRVKKQNKPIREIIMLWVSKEQSGTFLKSRNPLASLATSKSPRVLVSQLKWMITDSLLGWEKPLITSLQVKNTFEEVLFWCFTVTLQKQGTP